MNPKEFYDKVVQMRRMQKEYFKTRSKEALQKSKQLENCNVHIKTSLLQGTSFARFLRTNTAPPRCTGLSRKPRKYACTNAPSHGQRSFGTPPVKKLGL